MPAPARMHVGPHRGAFPAMNASRACEPGLRDSVSGREIREGGLSLLSPALAGAPVDGRRATGGPWPVSLASTQRRPQGGLRGHHGGDARAGGLSRAAGDHRALRTRYSPRRGGSPPRSKALGPTEEASAMGGLPCGGYAVATHVKSLHLVRMRGQPERRLARGGFEKPAAGRLGVDRCADCRRSR